MKAAATIVAVLIGIIAIAATAGGIYDKCGPLCRQDLLQAHGEHY
jgi:hypothetical protein